MMDFMYQNPLPLGQDKTTYRHIKGSEQYVSVKPFADLEMLKVAPEGLQELARLAMHDVSFFLRPAHNRLVARILDDPEASDNDRAVALAMLRNAEIAALGVLPICQDTGTAIIMAKKGQQVWTGCDDAEQLSAGIFTTYTKENLRYSQNAPLTMYDEVNTGDNLPAQIDIYAVPGDEYRFLFIAKGGGSANKSYLYQETKAVLNPGSLKTFLTEKMKTLGTAACPPYHIAFVIGGTSVEANLKLVKLASTKYLDELPTTGNKQGRAFRDIELEQELLQ
ncbi:MAG: fumarate hydratase, partial [Deltaproteobacteria bacterium]|nr:fumarate hydratase [Deltaproteobacteria bacterium]